MKRPGGNPLLCILDDDELNADDILSALKPYRCAIVKQDTPSGGPDARQENVLTAHDVGSHVFPQEGMYTIIDGHIYDLSGKFPFSLTLLWLYNLTRE